MELVTDKAGRPQRPRVVVIGEGMLEAVAEPGGGWRMGYGGDTLNTAIHLTRLGCDVAFLSALGEDPFSRGLREAWAAEGLDVSTVLTDPERQPGLYAIRTDAEGERSFTYWRDTSAARRTFALPGLDVALERLADADLILFSLISLAVLPDAGRQTLLSACDPLRRRGRVAFDGNYRPRLWASAAQARAARDAALTISDIGLPTLADEQLMVPSDAAGVLDAKGVADAWRRGGAAEVVVKLGSEGCRLPDDRIAPPPRLVSPIDTSGAGDAFNAGYLASRLRGEGPEMAARAGQTLAAWVITRPGAIPARDEAAPYG